MGTAATGRDVGGEGEIRNPKIFDVNIAECVDNRLIETFSGEHRCDGIRQIENLAMPLGHLFGPFASLLRDCRCVSFATIQGAHKCTNTHSADHIDGDASVLNGFQHANVGSASSSTSTQYQSENASKKLIDIPSD